MQSSEKGSGGMSISEQLLMNTEQVGILLVNALNTTNNETAISIYKRNIG